MLLQEKKSITSVKIAKTPFLVNERFYQKKFEYVKNEERIQKWNQKFNHFIQDESLIKIHFYKNKTQNMSYIGPLTYWSKMRFDFSTNNVLNFFDSTHSFVLTLKIPKKRYFFSTRFIIWIIFFNLQRPQCIGKQICWP